METVYTQMRLPFAPSDIEAKHPSKTPISTNYSSTRQVDDLLLRIYGHLVVGYERRPCL